MAVLVMSVDEALSRKLQTEAQAGNIPDQSYLIQQFKQFLRTTYPTSFKEEAPQPVLSDKQQMLQELIQIASQSFMTDYAFSDVIQASGYNLSPSETSTLASMFANATKKPGSKIVNLGKQGGSKVTMYINKMD